MSLTGLTQRETELLAVQHDRQSFIEQCIVFDTLSGVTEALARAISVSTRFQMPR